MAYLKGSLVDARAGGRTAILAAPETLVAAVCGAVILGIILRTLIGVGLPLWIDESWTGGIVSQESFSRAFQLTLLDSNTPLYYLVMYPWAQLFGLSDYALRFPSFLFGAAVPLVVLLSAKAIGREMRFIWCALLALWIPGIWYSQEARCYTLVLLLAAACTVAYARLLAVPDIRRAFIWCGLGALAILTHYYALPLVALQGLAYLGLHRIRAIKTWPALLAFLPVVVWIALQWPRLLQYSANDSAWLEPLSLADARVIIDFIVGDIGLVAALALIVAIPLIVRQAPPNTPVSSSEAPHLWLIVGTAASGAAIVILLGVMRPSFTPRYLMPFMPGILLGFAWAISQLRARWAPAPIAILVVMAAAAVAAMFAPGRQAPKFYSFEAASHALMSAGVEHVVFLWDNPLTRVYQPGQIEATGEFFFRREGRPVTIEPLFLKSGDDPNERLLAAARAQGSAILWLYDVDVRATAARLYPPRIAQLDPAWNCQDFGRGRFGVLACYRETSRPQ